MIVSILHISDLHRDPAQELSNQALIDSLEADRQRYINEDPPILSPSIVVVSGDLIYGVRHNHPEAASELSRQSYQAHDLLSLLADSFLDGDRNRIVLLPGNHDVSFPTTMASLRELKVAPNDPSIKEIAKQLWFQESTIRWNWDTLSFWQIADRALYDKRLDGFRQLYDRFYQGCGRRPYSLDPANQYDIFDYSFENVTIVAMSSCFQNDPLRRQGMIHPNCMAQASRAVKDPAYHGRLLIASWHHNTSGGPMTDDYMDSDVLQVLIDRGFSIGLHGHQHRPQFIDERFALDGKRKITVLSASTLCAGPLALPPGHRRGYNLLQVNTETNTATLHQRSMLNDDFSLPVWGPGTFPMTGSSVIQFNVQPPTSRPPSMNSTIVAAEQDIRAKKFNEARTRLLPLKDIPIVRPLLLETLSELRDHAAIIEHFVPPTNTTEAFHAMNAAWELADRQTLHRVLELPIVTNTTDPGLCDLRKKLGRRLSL